MITLFNGFVLIGLLALVAVLVWTYGRDLWPGFWDFWTKPIRGESLALFRILLAVTVLTNQLTGIGRVIPETCGPGGYLPIESNDEWTRRASKIAMLRGPNAVRYKITSTALDSLQDAEVPDEVLVKLERLKGREFKNRPVFLAKLEETLSADEFDRFNKRVVIEAATDGPGANNIPVLSVWLPRWLVRDYPWLDWLQGWTSPETAQAWDEWGGKLSSHYLLFGVYLVALVCLALGLGTRLSALAVAILAATFHNRLPWLMNGGDSLFRNGLYLLILAPAGCCWSLDRVIGRRLYRWLGWEVSNEPVTIPPWSVRLMQIQVCCMYTFTGLVKLGDTWFIDGKGWGDYVGGQALYWVLNDIAITRSSYHWLPLPLFVCRIMTWTTLAFELTFCFVVCFGRWRSLLIGLGVFLGILVAISGFSALAGVVFDWPVPARWRLGSLFAVLFGATVVLSALSALVAWPGPLLGWVLRRVSLNEETAPGRFLSHVRNGLNWAFPALTPLSPRAAVLLIGVSLHVGIFIVMEIGWFSQITLCWYALFVPGEKLSQLVEHVGVWLRGKPTEPEPLRLAA